MSNGKFIFSIVIFFFSICNSYADVVKGRIFDKESGKDIVGVVVYIKNSNGIPVSFCTSDKDGAFTVEYDSGMSEMTLEVRMLGYESLTFTPPFPSSMRIGLEPNAQEIKEAIIRADKVRQEGDTIIYSVPTLLSQNDRTLGDILKKLPGINVSKDGYVKYQGRSINRLYIDGHDLLEGQYNIATRNLDPKMLKQIEIYEDHQPIRALEGMVDSDNAALNVILRDGAKSKWIASIQGEFGGSTRSPWVPYSGSLWLMNIGKQYQTMNSLKTDAAGNNLSIGENGSGIILSEYSNEYVPVSYISIDHVTAPLEEKRTKFNTSYSASTNSKFAAKNGMTFGVSGKYEHEDVSSESSSVQIFDLSSGLSDTFTEMNSVNTRRQYANADISAELNSSKLYFKDKFRFDYKINKAANNLGGSSIMDENATNKGMNLINSLDMIGRSPSYAFGINMTTQYIENDEWMGITSSSGDTSMQTINGAHFYNDIRVNLTKKIGKHFKISSISYLEYLHRDFWTSLTGNSYHEDMIDTDNDIHLWYVKATEEAEVGYYTDRLKASVKALTWYQYINLIDKNAFTVNPSIKLKYDFCSELSGELNAVYSHSSLNEQQLFTGLIMQDYKYLRQGKSDLIQNPDYNIDAFLDIRYPMSGWYCKINAGWSANKSFIQTRYFIEDKIVTKLSNEVTDYSNINTDMELSKAFFNVNGKITLSLGGDRTKSVINQNSVLTPYECYNASAALAFVGSPAQWMSLEFYGEYSYSKYKTNETWDDGDYQSFFETLALTIFPMDKMELGIVAEHYLCKYTGEQVRQTIFLDASFMYDINDKLQLFMHANNILNQQSYSYSVLNPLQTSHFSFKIRPLNILLGFKLQF